jgi:L-threonylcarbamoyladenylate synthase
MGKVLSVAEAVNALLDGQILGLPTETVYGLGADATNESAVAQVFKAKNRPRFDPLIVHVPTLAAVRDIAELSEAAEQLFLAFSPGPLTVVLPKKNTIPDLVTSGHSTVAVRIPAHPVMLEVLHSSGLYIAAPSANPFGFASPTTAQHVLDQLGNLISGVVDGGPCSVGIESTIVDMSSGVPKVLRLGGMALEQLERVLGPIATQLSSSNPNAPGMLTSHYNPGIPVQLFKDREALLAALQLVDADAIGILYWGETISHGTGFNLSERRLIQRQRRIFLKVYVF